MKKLTRVLITLMLAMGVVIPAAFNGVVAAQGTAIGITPRKEFTVAQGATVQDSLNITNPLQDQTISLALNLVEFSSKDQTGTPQLDLNDDNTTTWSAKKFITLPKTVTLKGGETKAVPMTIKVPATQGAGSYYSAVRYQASSEGGSNVTVNAAAATLVFVNVPGDAKEQMTLKQLGAFSGDVNGTQGAFKLFFFGNQPKVVSYTLKNEGNVTERPAGSIVIKNSFTGKTYKIENANQKDSVALIGQERRFDSCIVSVDKTTQTATGEVTTTTCDNPKLTPGRYTVQLAAFYGQQNGKSLEVSGVSSFWYLPIWFVIVVIAVILAIVILIWWVVTKIKNRTPVRRR